MRSASSNGSGSGGAKRLGPFALGVLLLALLAGAASRNAADSARAIRVEAHRIVHGEIGPRELRRLSASKWQGITYTTSTGEPVRVLVSEAYPDAHATGQRWADYFASLLHGEELAFVTAYVVTPAEMADFCGSDALGCYGGNTLAFMGETVAGVTPEEVAAHEYGHHVAANRRNPPWRSIDYGPKRWASVANVCVRAQQGTAYPGNEGLYYTRNPGEAFAEVFRVLNELEDGATTFSWSLVDGSFYPDAAALQAAEEDVVAPWTAPATQSFRGRFVRNGRNLWRTSLETPLDGGLAVTLTFPKGALHELTVLTPEGRELGRGLWSGTAAKQLTTTVCGHRSLVLRVARRGSFGRFALRVTHD